ncbi:hypothetical protein [Roseomonas sp. AR75]|uniref:hypothetical protein n=1 Tax=Roseomonas sp. AR75 TaxID=2562311 RepID=UPI0010C14A81|nr:hypothetical protein [Roseomonas sp. AR75]
MSDRNDPRTKAERPTEDLRTTASEAASSIAAEASAAARTVKEEGAAVLETAKARASEAAEQGVKQGARQVGGVARAIHRAADELEKESPELARTIHDAAGRVDGMARALRERSPRDLLRTAEDFARRQPLAFFGVATLAGFALARFARASADHHHETTHGRMQPGITPESGPMRHYGHVGGNGPLVAAAPGDSGVTAEKPEGTATLVAAQPGESVTGPQNRDRI